MKTKILYTLAAALAASLAATTIHAQQASDQIIYTPTGLDVLLPENGPPGSEFLPAFAPVPNLPNQAILMYEGVPGQSLLSDALWVQGGYLYFESDYNDVLSSYPGSSVVPTVASIEETGTLQDLGVLLTLNGLPGGPPALPPNTLLVSSDVPEPSTLALIGMGWTALATLLRRRKA